MRRQNESDEESSERTKRCEAAESLQHRITEACGRFETELRGGKAPRIEDFLSRFEQTFQPAILKKMLVSELGFRVQQGEPVAREEYYHRFPSHQDVVRAVLEMHASTVDTNSHSICDGETGGRSLRVRCPSCNLPIEVKVDTLLTDLTCGACGSRFSLVDQTQETRWAAPISSVGRFDLIERLGMGQFGTVWKARDRELDRTVAIKIPRQSGMTVEEKEKFLREARAAAQLNHPNIVSVHEVGRDGDTVFIVSDLVRGVTLAEWLGPNRLTSREAAELCANIGAALQHAHDQRVVHRDLKPANIMMDANHQPHLMDFGLARREMGEVTMTIDGYAIGTPAYMSPEQADGKGHAADRRSDVYSLGVILFQLLTGERPFRGNARMIIHQVIHDEPPSPRKFNGHVPRDLETITLKCLEKSPDQRYQSADELCADLRRYLSGRPIAARPCGVIGRVWRWYQRNTMAVVFTAGGYFVVMSIILLCWGLMGLGLALLGVIEASQRATIELLLLVCVFYPVTLLVGVLTLRGRVMGIAGGSVITSAWTLLTLLAAFKVNLGLLQLEVMSAARTDPFFHFQLTTLLLLISGIGTLLYVGATIATIRMRREIAHAG